MKTTYAMLLLGFSLSTIGCGSSSDSSSGLSSGSGNIGGQFSASTPLNGIVYLKQLAPQAQLSLKLFGSETVYGTMIASPSGTFTIPAGLSLPGRFRVVATTPEGLQVERVVDATSVDSYLWINIPSHLVSLYNQAHPELTAAQAEARVKQGLGLPPTAGLNGVNDTSVSPFSHSLFLARAAQNGGFESYARQLITQFDQGQVISFRVPGFSIFTEGAESPGVIAKIGGFLGEQSASYLFDAVATEAIGRIIGYFGLNIGTAGALDQIDKDLKQVETEITQLQQQVTALANSGLSALDQTNVQSSITALNTTNSLLQTTAGAASSTYSLGNPSATDHGPSAVPGNVTTTISSFGAVTSSNSQQVLTQALTSANVSQNLLSLQAKSGQISLGINSPSLEYGSYELRTDAQSAPLRSIINYYGSWLQVCANVFSEDGGSKYLSAGLSAQGLNPPSTFVNADYDSILAINSGLRLANQSAAVPVGSDVVLVDSTAGLMWYLVTEVDKYNVAQNNLITLSVGPWGYASGYTKPTAVGSSVSKDLLDYSRPSDLAGWRVPEVSEYQTLYARVQALGGGNGDKDKTLTAMQKLGFQGLSTDHDNFKKLWVNGAVYTDQGALSFHYFNMSSGNKEFDYHDQVSPFDPDADPKYTIMYVRSIPDVNYQDTVQQAANSYGLLPTTLSIGSTLTDNSASDIYQLTLNASYAGFSLSDITSRAQWTVSDSSVAYIGYDKKGHPDLIFNKPGTVTVTGSTAVSVSSITNTRSATITLSSQKTPQLQSIAVTPLNVDLQGRPGRSDFLQFYCTGYLSNRRTVDLRQQVTWSLTDPGGFAITDPNAPFFSPTTAGDLVFGTSLPFTLYQVTATYLKGQTRTGVTWADPSQDLTQTVKFSVP